MLLNRTVERTGTSMVSVLTTGNGKALLTVAPGVLSDGQKLLPMVILKRKTLPKETFPAGTIVEVNPKGWMDEEMMKNWPSEVYIWRPNGFFSCVASIVGL